MRIKGVIFDLDGVIVDTAEHHYLAWKRLCEELGIPCPPERKDQVRGVSRRRSLEIILEGREVSEEEAEQLMARKDRYYQELIQCLSPKDLLPGVRELLFDLRQKGVKVAVATVSKNARDVLMRLEILDEFDVLVDGYSGARSKPDPDLFLYAAAKMGVPPSECVVLEDAPAGIEAAEAAGMYAVGIGPEERFQNVRATIVLPTLADLSLDKLVQLLSEKKRRASAWVVEENGFDLETQRRAETNFAIGNGYLGTRGVLEEVFPGELRATLINGFYDVVPLYHAELVNIPDWTAVHLRVNKETFSLRQGEVLLHHRSLDLRDGIFRRRVRWRNSEGKTVEVRTTRFASMADPHLCVQTYAVTALDFEGPIELRAMFYTAAENPGVPPFPEIGLTHWKKVSSGFVEDRSVFVHLKTRGFGEELGMAMCLELAGIPTAEFLPIDCPEHPGILVRAYLRRGETIVITKFVTVHTSLDTKNPVEAALNHLAQARHKGLYGILRDHRAAWWKLWQDCDVIIDGDDIVQRAMRFNLYHLLIAAPKKELSVPAKGLTGFGYRGHVFWDTDIFVLPFFIFTCPDAARRILTWRHQCLPQARENARKRGFWGAMYPWEADRFGRETTPRWVPNKDGDPISIFTGEREHHITADVAYAVWQYWQATGDNEFMRDKGVEILLSTAQFWISRLEQDGDKYVIRHVIGPDEYHEDVDNNAYTNWMARWNLKAAVRAWKWLAASYPEAAISLRQKLNLSEEEIERWETVADAIFIPYDAKSRLFEQFSGYFSLEDVDLQALEPRSRSIYDLLGPERTSACQIIKQPDVLMLFHLFPEEFSLEDLRANWDYYEPRTDHKFGSSLGPAIHAALAARLGKPPVAYAHLLRALLVDLEDLRGNTADGIHLASAGGSWQAIVFGFAGVRFDGNGPVAWPNIPENWKRLAFTIQWRGQRFFFDLSPDMKGPVRPKPL